MSQSQNQSALTELESSFTLLQEDLQRFQSGERFWRSWDRSKSWVAASRKAQSYMELAMEALNEPARLAEEGERQSGWLSRTVKGLSQYLCARDACELEEVEENPGNPLGEAPPIAPSMGDEGVLQGHGAVVELPDLIGMIRGQGMTGVLTLDMPKETVQMHFQLGQLVHAYSESAPRDLRLGEILVTQEAISRERMDSLLFCHQDSPQMLGETLLNGGLVSPEQLQEALNHQIQSLFNRIFENRKQASFKFVPGLPETKAQRAQVNVMQLLLDSARAFDERQAG
ncbi:MAG: DUF4388 domain-containing protein [Planctomycetota bacterium]|nr:DUF4388 domain-containing protein [Planctomycetota bacterium]